VRNFHASVFLPSTTSEYIENIFMAFGAWNPNDVNPRLVPPTWALTVEIFFYILICMGISRTFARVKIWLSLSLLYVVASFILGLPSQERYFPFAAASLPFAIGSCIYFLSKDEEVYALYLRLRISAKSIFLLVLANCLIFTQIRFGSLFADVGLYINLGLCALLVYSVIKGERIINIGDSLDKRIGDFSYPIYLLHWQMGLVASYLIYGSAFHEFSYRGWVSATVAMVLSVLMSLIFITVLDKPLQIIRSRIKRNTVLQGQSPPGSG
jgi:peptidoglycan/LPS O-acetylase OafA/YrhL